MTLKELRKSKGLTQLEASKLTDIPLRTYKRIELDNKVDSFKYKNALSILKGYSYIFKNNNKIPKHSYKIAIAGIGYVGLSLGILLSQDNEVTLVDILQSKVGLLNKHISPIKDNLIEEYLSNKKLNIRATTNKDIYKDVDMVIIATPTNFDEKTNNFDTSSVVEVIDIVNKINPNALIIIKSTIPIGFTESIKNKYSNDIIFSPEFLREGYALYDNLYPSRIIIGGHNKNKKVLSFSYLLEEHALNLNKAVFMSATVAEAVKLFSNAYLAMRVAYFNELDSYALTHNLDTSNIIKGIGLDPRIGDYYNNPSFGYGGYCLPKDSAQLSSSFIGIANSNLIQAILISNQTRKEFIADEIIKFAIDKTNKDIKDITIGIYKLAMKTNSDNYRSSSSLDIYNLLVSKGIKAIIYDKSYLDSVNSFDDFIKQSDVIISNRMYKELSPYKNITFTRDIYKRD
ncbi:MAG: nucleotide sugar dehydrogenase [Bacilli bacterium]|nr:nucleotide sugar dehydrogenase [Bacilli bacterium]